MIIINLIDRIIINTPDQKILASQSKFMNCIQRIYQHIIILNYSLLILLLFTNDLNENLSFFSHAFISKLFKKMSH